MITTVLPINEVCFSDEKGVNCGDCPYMRWDIDDFYCNARPCERKRPCAKEGKREDCPLIQIGW